jgi:lactate dehydrogenase-like 2-hydroxyacid dehydrogenase
VKPDVLVLVPIHEPTLAALARDYAVHELWRAPDPERYLAQVGGRVRALVTTGVKGFDRRLLEALPALEIVACFGTPRGTVDLDAARARGVEVTHTPSAIAESVADLALGLIIAVMRRIGEADRFVRAGKWLAGLPPLGRELGGKTCGLLGLGAIGVAVAQRVSACGMSVCYHGPRPKPECPYAYCPDPETLAQRSDCLVAACPLTPETRGLVNARVLAALGPEGFLVNVARGPVVEEQALIAALRERRIAGAALDVYWDEPRVPDALLSLENVVLTPHIGSSTHEVRAMRKQRLLENLREHFAGRPPPWPLTAQEMKR